MHMIYTNMTKKALRIAFDAHKEQVDKTGLPYVFHPFHLAEQMCDEISVCVALLHDVVEDTPITFDDLVRAEMADEVIAALRLLTHDPSISYMEYIKAIKEKGNKTALAVKLADLHHNSDVTRLEIVDDRMCERLKKYKNAIDYLEAQYIDF